MTHDRVGSKGVILEHGRGGKVRDGELQEAQHMEECVKHWMRIQRERFCV